MDSKSWCQFAGYTLLATGILGSVLYGLVTGWMPTLGGEGRIESEIIWQSRTEDASLYWFGAVFNSVFGALFVYMAVKQYKGEGDDE